MKVAAFGALQAVVVLFGLGRFEGVVAQEGRAVSSWLFAGLMNQA